MTKQKQNQQKKAKTIIKKQEQAPPQQPKSKRTMLYPVLIISLLAFIVYGNTIGHDYALDDSIVIVKNEFTKKGIQGIPDILKNDSFTGFFGKKKDLVAGGRYRPFSVITFAIGYEVFGKNPAVNHFSNILLYAITCVLLFLILQRLFPSDKWYFSLAFIASCFYLLHPVHTEVVANIKGRDEIMSLLFALLTLQIILMYHDKKKIFYLVLSGFTYFLAMMSKENAVTFILIIPLTIYFFTKTSLKSNFLSIIPVVATFLVFMYIRRQVLGPPPEAEEIKELMNNPFLHAKGGEKLATIFFTLLLYIKLLFFPHPLTYDYYPYHIELTGWELLPILSLIIYAVMGVFALIWLIKKKNKIIAYGIWFYLLSISLFTNILFPVGTFMNERFIFVASIGFCLIAGWFFTKKLPQLYKNQSKIQMPVILILTVIFLLYGYKTIERNKAWKDDLTLFITDVETSPGSAKSNCSAGGKLIEKAQLEKDSLQRQNDLKHAMKCLKRSLKIHPTYKDAWLLMGNCYFEYNRQYQKALESYLTLLKLNPQHNLAFNNALLVLKTMEQPEIELPVYEKLYKINPDHYDVNYNLGYLHGKYKQDIKQAIHFLERATKIDPDRPEAYKDLGVAYGFTGNFEKSISNLKKAERLDPKDPQIYQNLFMSHFKSGNLTEAAKYKQKAKAMKKQPQ